MAASGAYRSSIAPQLSAFERRVRRFTYKTMIDGGRRWRSSMIRERLSGKSPVRLAKWERLAGKEKEKIAPNAPLGRKTGKAIRSLQYRVFQATGEMKLTTYAGGSPAWYLSQYEPERLAFGRISRREMQRVIQNLRIGYQFITRDAGRAQTVADLPSSPVDPDRAALLGELGETFQGRRSSARALRREQRSRLRRERTFRENLGETGLSDVVDRLAGLRGGP